MPRLHILNATERVAYDKPPVLNSAEQRRAFDLPSSLFELAGTVQEPVQRIGLLVSAAYFSSTKRVFPPGDYRKRDVARTRQRHELVILEAHGMRRLDRESEAELLIDIDAMATTHLRPKLIFWRCLDLLAQRRIQLPSEHRLTALITSAMARRKQQLVERVENVLTPELREALDGLFAFDDDGSGGTGKSARLTLLKRLTQSTAAKAVRDERLAGLIETVDRTVLSVLEQATAIVHEG